MPIRDAHARGLWARTVVRVWPERYVLVSLDPALAREAASLVTRARPAFAALLVEREEASLTLPRALWRRSPIRRKARAEAGPFRVLTFDLALELDTIGYIAPAAARLAASGVPIVPQCGYRTDHVLVRERDLARARRALRALVAEAAAESGRGRR
jgi:hypothetical protein